MAKIIDLREMVQDNLEFKLLDGSVVKVPGNFSTKFISDLLVKEQELRDEDLLKDPVKQMDVLVDMVYLIFSQDKESKITKAYIKKELDLNLMSVIIESTFKHMKEVVEAQK